ncbi:hypothetical protein A5714_00095 [Mycobacterium sp. E2462]|uniref:SseB family protein n=1 Tax=Mycobacterium sp. E2462 TaxID=1834133 RepID=UPI0007FC59C8|nr:SseB family protein [Mycobacterium sp. E2462]OBI18443.1 hypothetical protein A5714_00095 [Mycobacterium sp. E2462]
MAKVPASDDVEELISVAARSEGEADLTDLVHTLRSHEVFMPFKRALRQGKEVKTVPLLLLPDGTHAMMVYTSRTHSDLPDSFAGATFESALQAALKMPALDWVIITNESSEWVSIHKTRIPAYLDEVRNDPTDASPSRVEHNSDVEELISRAVGSTSISSVAAVTAALENREVFLDMSTVSREDGRQSMNTFIIEPLGLTIRAYTNRIRPGIRYGGLRWPALREMVRELPDIKGVQVMNNSDDWIIIDRKSLGLNESN